jgi:arylsulfatase A-like enzyme
LRLLNFNVEAQCTPSRSAVLTGRHPIRSGTQTVPITGGADGLTRWEVTIAQALADAGYATGMWGKWHLGSDPEHRSPVDFGFDEAVWSPRTADEVLWTTQSYFPNGTVTSAPYTGKTQIPIEPEPIYSRKKGAKAEVIATYDAEFRAGFDRKITGWAMDFITRSKQDGKPFYMYLPYTQVHIPPIPDPQYAGKTKRGNMADLLTQMDDFTGMILTKLEELGLAEDTIVVWTSDNGADPHFRMPAMDPDPLGAQWDGFSGPWRGGYFTSLEGSNRVPCIIRWPGKVPAGKVSNELVHLVDMFTTLVLAAGAKVPDDRQIDGMDMRDFLLGEAEGSGRDTILCIQGNRLQAVKWRQWKIHLFQQDDMISTWAPYNLPHLHNLEWDPREEHVVGFPHAWVAHPMAAAAAAFLKTLAIEPPIKPGTPDPYLPPKPGEVRAEEHLQIGVITQYVNSLAEEGFIPVKISDRWISQVTPAIESDDGLQFRTWTRGMQLGRGVGGVANQLNQMATS